MTSISSGNAALTILQQVQPSLLQASPVQSASDTILDIVSNRSAAGSKAGAVSAGAASKPQQEAAQGPRAVGGTVSSEISSAQRSGMAAAVTNQLDTIDYDDPLIAFTPVQKSVENADAFIQQAVRGITDYNGRLEPDAVVPSREEYTAKLEKWGAERIAKGEDAEKVGRDVAYFTSDRSYNKEATSAQMSNDGKRENAAFGAHGLAAATARFSEVFGLKLEVSYNDKGEGSIKPFELKYGNGQTMMSYGEDGSLATYNTDGSVRSAYAQKDVIQR